MKCFAWPVRIYYEDTDHGGVVYYANYLKYTERCRTEFLRAQGIEQDWLASEHDLVFAIHRSEVDYIFPAKFNDLLLVTARISRSSRVKLGFEHNIYRMNTSSSNIAPGFMAHEQIEKDNQLICRAAITAVSLCASTLRPIRTPKKIFEELMREH